MVTRIVVGTDGSEHAQEAVAFAADLASQLRAEVVLVHAVGSFPPAIASTAGMMYVPQGVIDESRDVLERRVLTEFAQPLVDAAVPWRAEIRDGWAPRVIAQVAREVGARFIVVGTRGLHALGELFLGSTSHALTHETDVPLIVVPGTRAHRTKQDGATLAVLGSER